MNDLYCMSSTYMLLKMMEKSRNSVCPPKKKFVLRVSRKKKSCITSGPEKKIPPYPITFLKKSITSGAGQFFWATQFLPLICSLFLLRQSLYIIFFGAFSLCRSFFRQLPTPTTPTPSPSQIKNTSPTIGNLASSRVKSDCVTYKWTEVKRHFRFESLIFRN